MLTNPLLLIKWLIKPNHTQLGCSFQCEHGNVKTHVANYQNHVAANLLLGLVYISGNNCD